LRLDDDIFSALATVAGGALDAAESRASATGIATAAADRILYDTSTGELYYDADGAAAAILFATLTGAPEITAADFLLVG
jgi:Ca2+-binding RTX toxin-like protein